MALPSLPQRRPTPKAALQLQGKSNGTPQSADNAHNDLLNSGLISSRSSVNRELRGPGLPVVGSRAASKTASGSSGHVDNATASSTTASSSTETHIRRPLKKSLKKAATLPEREQEKFADVGVSPLSARTTHVLRDPRPPKEGQSSASRLRTIRRRISMPAAIDVGPKLVPILEFNHSLIVRLIYREAKIIRQARRPNESNNSPLEVFKSSCMDVRAAVKRYLIVCKAISFMWENVERRAPFRQRLRIITQKIWAKLFAIGVFSHLLRQIRGSVAHIDNELWWLQQMVKEDTWAEHVLPEV